MKVAVLGSGGIGGFLGGALARASNDVWFIARGKHLQALRGRGLIIESVSIGNFELKVNATDKPADVGEVDLVLFCVKSYDTEPALKQMNPLIGKDTLALSFQNGVDNEDKIGGAIGEEHILAGVISVESYIAEPGKIVQSWGPARTAFGEMSGQITQRSRRILEAFRKAGLKVELSDRIKEILWEKFLFICASGGVCSVARSSIGQVLDFEATRELFAATMKEVEAVARAKGIDLSKNIVTNTLALSDAIRKEMKPSMLRDLEEGKRLEVDALNGTISRFGRQLSVSTPVNDFIYACLKLQDVKVARG